MYCFAIISALALGMPFAGHCQTSFITAGARNLALANASVAITDEWAYYNNAAALGGLTNISAGASFETKYNFSSLTQKSFVFTLPFAKWVAASGISTSGNNFYNESLIGMAVATKIHTVGVGLKLSYFQLCTEESVTRKSAIIEFGGMVPITSKLVIGCNVWNATRSALKIEGGRAPMPVVMRVGLFYGFHPKLTAAAEVHKSLSDKAVLKAGLEYSIVKCVAFRLGAIGQPLNYTAGIGLKCKTKILFDYGFTTHAQLGATHQISVNYILRNH